MPLDLPDPIARFFDADRSADADALARCFTEDARVRDEGHTYVGREAIRRWRADVTYTYTVEPTALASDGDRTVVTSHLEGDFPGGSADLRFFFVLNGDQIADLEIMP